MTICYVIEDVPEEELQNVKDGIAVDNCTPVVEDQGNGLYKVKAVCEDSDESS